MGSIGNCCCTCYIPDNYELPTITKTGWSASGWTGTCCKCMTLTPNTPYTWQNCCTTPFLTQTRTSTETTKYRKVPTVKPKVGLPNNNLPCVFNVQKENCCPDPSSELADLIKTTVNTNTFKLLAGIKLAYIEICISKQQVTCGNDPPATKWIVSSKFFFYYTSRIVRGRTSNATWEVRNFNDSCFELNSTPFTTSCSSEEVAPCDLNTISNSDPGALCVLASGIASFNRVKFYDTLPTGTVSFSDSDLGTDCTWDSCGSNDLRDLSFCMSVSSVPSCGEKLEVCSCNTSSTRTATETTFNIGSACCTKECNPVLVPGGPDYPVTWLVGCCDGDAVYSFCNPADCLYPIPECGQDTAYTWEAGNFNDCHTSPYYFLNVSCPLSSTMFYSLFVYKTCDQNSACYWNEGAGTTCQSGCGTPKYNLISYLASSVIDTTCNFVAKQCCFNSPSWSVNFG